MSEGTVDSLLKLLRTACKGLDGQSASLDENLKKLRKDLMKESGPVSDELIQSLEQDIRILHLERQENSQDFLDVGFSWQRSLKNHELNASQQQRLLEVTDDFRDSQSRLYQIPASFKILLDIQLAIDKLVSVSPSDQSDNTQYLKIVADAMIQLLSQITPSGQSSNQYQKLLSQLEIGLSVESLSMVLGEITKFVEVALAAKGDDFNRYLKGLNEQLNEVQQFISKTQAIEADCVEQRSASDGAVRDSVGTIRNVVDDATEIEALQQELNIQLNNIVAAMDALKDQEQARESELQVNYNLLQERVTEMESEAEKFQSYIAKEREQARLDELTKLPNRTAYNEIINHQLGHFKRYNQPLSLVVCDLDHFKQVNDNYGHLAGDKVLSIVAKILCKGTRSSDFVTRYGGEEFAIIVPSTEADRAAKAMDKIRLLICKSPFNYRGKPISISMSFGVSEANSNDTVESLFARADAALYKAKESGRNTVSISNK